MANEIILNQKKEIVKNIEDGINNNKTVVLFDYAGLSDQDIKKIRKSLKEQDSQYKVYKNTLLKRAMDNLKIDVESYLKGPSALALSQDQLAPIKILYDFKKENDKLNIKFGLIDKEIVTEETLKKLSFVPGRDELLTMLAAGMIEKVRDLAICLDLYAKQKEENK